MKQALEACKGVWNGGLPFHHVERMGKAIKALEEALAKQEQGEPVAQWQKRHIEETDGMWCDTNEGDAQWWISQKHLHGWEVRKVYTTPQQRKPLTDEQADSIIDGLRTCLHRDSKRDFLKTWLRDWAAHGIKE
jgi:hypothetical protein